MPWRKIGVMLLVLAGSGCDGLFREELPPEVTDPKITRTPQGALAVYNGTVAQFRQAYGTGPGQTFQSSFVGVTGLLGDELHTAVPSNVSTPDLEDVRYLPEANDQQRFYPETFGGLQFVRGQGGQAIGLLNDYLPEKPALMGHVYALQGYAEVALAELFCSGIPLSTLDYNGQYTPKPGSTTEEVFTHAVALFDSALTFASDSTRFMELARVGKGRALLALGRYADAAATVAPVPDTYTYDLLYSASGPGPRNFAAVNGVWDFSVADREGANGLNYRTSDDPRTRVTATSSVDAVYWHPDKYSMDGSTPIVLASGVEARLIEAEAALRAGDVSTWLNTMNRLRTNGLTTTPADTIADTLGVTGCGPGSVCGTFPGGSDVAAGQPAGGFLVPDGYSFAFEFMIDPVSDDIANYCYNYSWYMPCYVDHKTTVQVYTAPAQTGWSKGVGGVFGLMPLEDPGTLDARVDLLFRERAFWLFLTGHRQGDMRRLIRQYDRLPEEVYPVGDYHNIAYQVFGSDVTAPVPAAERTSNPKYSRCISRRA